MCVRVCFAAAIRVRRRLSSKRRPKYSPLQQELSSLVSAGGRLHIRRTCCWNWSAARGVDGMVAGIVRTRCDFVDDQFMRIADNKHFYLPIRRRSSIHRPNAAPSAAPVAESQHSVGLGRWSRRGCRFRECFRRGSKVCTLSLFRRHTITEISPRKSTIFSKTQSTPPCSANAALSSFNVLTRIWPLPS